MANSNGRGPMSDDSQTHGRDVVRVYEHLVAQDRWIGVAYDRAGGALVATASRGTRASTREALEQAALRVLAGPSAKGATSANGRATIRAPKARTRRAGSASACVPRP